MDRSNVVNGIDLTQHLGLIGIAVQRSRWAVGAVLEERDLFNAGFFGLRRAAERFDPGRGFKFSTYAMHWVRHYVRRAVADQRRTVRIPVWLQDRARRGVRDLPLDAVSLDARHAGELDAKPRLESIVAESDPSAEFETAERRKVLQKALANIPERLRGVLVARFWGSQTLQQIGNALDLSRERVRQLERDALALLKENLKEDP